MLEKCTSFLFHKVLPRAIPPDEDHGVTFFKDIITYMPKTTVFSLLQNLLLFYLYSAFILFSLKLDQFWFRFVI